MKYFLVISLFLSGCSAFQPKQQKLYLTGLYQHVLVNDKPATVPSIVTVDRDKSVTIVKKEGKNVTFVKTVSPVPSVWGKLDAWGVYFLYPGIGLFTPGALELETDTVFVN